MKLVGRPICLDAATAEGTWGLFARACVELDLEKPLVAKINVDGVTRRVEYESLPTICYECGCVGHRKENCPILQPNITGSSTTPGTNLNSKFEIEKFGAWMQVVRRRKPNQKQNSNGKSNNFWNGSSKTNTDQAQTNPITGDTNSDKNKPKGPLWNSNKNTHTGTNSGASNPGPLSTNDKDPKPHQKPLLPTRPHNPSKPDIPPTRRQGKEVVCSNRFDVLNKPGTSGDPATPSPKSNQKSCGIDTLGHTHNVHINTQQYRTPSHAPQPELTQATNPKNLQGIWKDLLT